MSPAIRRIARLDLRFEQRPWAFAIERRADIETHFAALKRRKPGVWNGRVLMLHTWSLQGDCLRGAFLETDFASFDAWRRFGRSDRSVADCFSAAAVQGSDGGFLLGVMSAGTATAGHVYFPCGTPDPDDVRGGRVDLEASCLRELQEETGLDAASFRQDSEWTLVDDGDRMGLFRVLHGRETADQIRERVVRHLSAAPSPELSDVRIVRAAGDIDHDVLPAVAMFLRHRLV